MLPEQPVVMLSAFMREMYLQKALSVGTSVKGATVQAAGSPSPARMMKAAICSRVTFWLGQ